MALWPAPADNRVTRQQHQLGAWCAQGLRACWSCSPAVQAYCTPCPATLLPAARGHPSCWLTCFSALLSHRCASSASGATPAVPRYRARPYSSWPSRCPALAARLQQRMASSGHPPASSRRARTTSAETLPSLAACRQARGEVGRIEAARVAGRVRSGQVPWSTNSVTRMCSSCSCHHAR